MKVDAGLTDNLSQVPEHIKKLERLGIEGWGDLQPELNLLSKQGKWDEMGLLITDDILARFAIVAEPDQVISKFKERFSSLADRTTLSIPASDDDHLSSLITEMKAS